MMTPEDHAAEARKIIEDAYSDDPAILNGIKALAHATLALVDAQEAAAEQARIANWIAYLSQHDKIPAAHREWIEAAMSGEDV